MSQIIKLEELNDEKIQAVAKAAKGCKIIAFPTDTVYGIGSTGVIKAAARRIYQIKERPSIKPLPVFVHSIEAAKKWVEWTPLADALARKFWPGQLTLVLKHTKDGELLTFPEYKTVAIRVPAHPQLLKIIEASGVPWVQTSANKSGDSSLLDGAAVTAALNGVVDWIIEGGKASGLESTIVDASKDKPIVLREGAIKAADILSAGAIS